MEVPWLMKLDSLDLEVHDELDFQKHLRLNRDP